MGKLYNENYQILENIFFESHIYQETKKEIENERKI